MRTGPIQLLVFLFALSVAAMARAQNFDSAAAAVKADLDKALNELAAVRQQVANEKVPLSKKINDLQNQVAGKRREWDKIQRLRGGRTYDLDTLKAEVKARRDEASYIASLLDEYLRSFESRIHISEIQRYKGTIQEAKLAIEDVNLSPAEKFNRQVTLVRSAMKRIENLVGGDIFEGSALAPDGSLQKGKFALIGPIAVFASEQRDDAGLCEMQRGTLEPAVIDIGENYKPAIRTLLTSGSGELPVDASLGSAVKIASTKETLVEHIRKGGPVMTPILLLALAAAIISVYKWVELSGVRIAKPEDLQHILNELSKGNKAGAEQYAASVRGPAGELLKTAVANAREGKEMIEEILYEKVLSVKPKLERMLAFIAVTAATEPMLGLLGTVTGIIRTFKLITVFGTGDPKLLSSGISEALITTEYGLYFAIPGLLVHALLSRKVKRLLASMEHTVVGFLNGIARS